jgi:hypothetical protein
VRIVDFAPARGNPGDRARQFDLTDKSPQEASGARLQVNGVPGS